MAVGSSAQVSWAFVVKDNATATIKNVSRGLDNLKKTTSKMAKNVKQDFTKLSFAIAGIAAGITAATISAIKSAVQDEASTSRLIAALTARKMATDANLASVQKLIVAGQNLAFTDDEVRSSIEVATRFTNNFSKAQQIASIAQEVARATGQDLATATLNVGKAYKGSGARILTALGITKKGIKGQEALRAILDKTRGSADAYGKTTEGSFEIVRIKIQEIKESLGSAFLSPLARIFTALQPHLDDFAKWVNNQLPAIKTFADDIATTIIAKMPEFFTILKTEIPKAIGAVQGFIESVKRAATTAGDKLGFLLTSGIGAAFGGLRGVIAANLVRGGIDPLQAYFTGVVAQGVIEGVIKGLASELVVKAIASFGLKMAAASAASSAATAVGGVATTAGGVATAGAGIGLAAISAAAASPFIAGAIASAFLTPEQKANYKTSGMPDVNVFIGAENVADKVVPVLARDARVSPRGGR
jgi:hypothetical protein